MDGSVPGPAKVTPDELTSEVLLILSLPIFSYHFLLRLFYFFGLFMFLLWYYGRCGSTYAETGHSQRTPKLLKRC